jgi:hypothetical protein
MLHSQQMPCHNPCHHAPGRTRLPMPMQLLPQEPDRQLFMRQFSELRIIAYYR